VYSTASKQYTIERYVTDSLKNTRYLG